VVDPSRVQRKLTALARYRDELEPLGALASNQYLEGDHAFAGRYLVQASAQVCIDLANHVIASSGWRTAKDFRDAFTVLEENGVLEAGLASRLRKLAGLRNLLVHGYEDIDDSLVHQSLGRDLDDLNAFAQAIAALVEREEHPEG